METMCKECGNKFLITNDDREFYQKMDLPEPKACPSCRQQARMASINQTNLYMRKCAKTGVPVISHYSEEGGVKVVSQDYYYSDQHDGIVSGRDYDFSKPFFQQYAELFYDSYLPPLMKAYFLDENSDYTNYGGYNQNCYMIFDSDKNRDCLYSYGLNSSESTLDCYRGDELKVCYQCVDCKKCYNCDFCERCDNCSDSKYLRNCIGCRNCLFCSNLTRKEYAVFNEVVGKERFEAFVEELRNPEFLREQVIKWLSFRVDFPQKSLYGLQNEDCVGDYLMNCKNAKYCFDCRDLRDGKYCNQIFMTAKDCMDCHECGEIERAYECVSVAVNGYNMRFVLNSGYQSSDLTYCDCCSNSQNLFGCVGLKRKQYCILNKQYSEEEYNDLLPKIIEHMKSTGEWGDFFPKWVLPVGYNESVAAERRPLSEEEAKAAGWKWRDEPMVREGAAGEGARECKTCGRAYRVVQLEKDLYSKKGLAEPVKCFHCRNGARRDQRNPRELWERKCDVCAVEMLSSFKPGRPEKVCCDKCYLDVVVSDI